jgi:hypothetical protein
MKSANIEDETAKKPPSATFDGRSGLLATSKPARTPALSTASVLAAGTQGFTFTV